MRLRSREAVAVISLAIIVVYALGYQAEKVQSVPDFGAFYSVARAVLHGGLPALHHLYQMAFQIRADSIFSHGPHRAFWVPFVDMPTALLPLAPFALLPFTWAWALWDGLGLLACAGGVYWLARQQGLGADALPLALAVTAGYPTFMALVEGQYDLLLPLCLALITAAWYSGQRWRRWLQAMGAAFLFSFKPDLLLLAVVPAVAAWRRPLVRVALACLVLLGLACLALVGLPGLLHLPSLEYYTLFHRFPPTFDQTVLGFLWQLSGGRSWASLGAYLALALAASLLALAWWRNPPRTQTDWLLALTTTVCLSLVVAPHALSHDMILLAGPAIWTAAALRRSGRDLSWLALWMCLLNLLLLLHTLPLELLPVPLFPFGLLGAAVAAWRARTNLQAGSDLSAVPRRRAFEKAVPLSLP
ncbi:MAG: glycosyltransferase 87 family protein [Candidatus Dormibacteria bacterium]